MHVTDKVVLPCSAVIHTTATFAGSSAPQLRPCLATSSKLTPEILHDSYSNIIRHSGMSVCIYQPGCTITALHYCTTTTLNLTATAATTIIIIITTAIQRKLIVPRYRLNIFGRRCFAVAGPSTWNSLPDSLHDPALSLNILGVS